ncbi:hypothetical protein Mapa_001686 [Marchantia paleacea]|nr:hypothetical protein Mapa_001686 [Marchantia paleacea]
MHKVVSQKNHLRSPEPTCAFSFLIACEVSRLDKCILTVIFGVMPDHIILLVNKNTPSQKQNNAPSTTPFLKSLNSAYLSLHPHAITTPRKNIPFDPHHRQNTHSSSNINRC